MEKRHNPGRRLANGFLLAAATATAMGCAGLNLGRTTVPSSGSALEQRAVRPEQDAEDYAISLAKRILKTPKTEFERTRYGQNLEGTAYHAGTVGIDRDAFIGASRGSGNFVSQLDDKFVSVGKFSEQFYNGETVNFALGDNKELTAVTVVKKPFAIVYTREGDKWKKEVFDTTGRNDLSDGTTPPLVSSGNAPKTEVQRYEEVFGLARRYFQ